ncbi:MAG TPA: YqaJ viral recombinase family protein [Bacteroidia bacterium]
MIHNSNRIAAITSSQVYRIMGAPKPRQTYITEIKMERRLLRSINTEVNTRPITWGHLCERMAFQSLGLNYKYYSDETKAHPSIPFYAGSPDGENVPKKSVIDIKCPFTLKAFCELLEICEKKDIEYFKEEKPEYYWQLVSNALIIGYKHAELIVYMPYYETLGDIVTLAESIETVDQYRFFWVKSANYDELPYILKESNISELNSFEFEIPQSDFDLLETRVKQALSEI